MPKSFSKQDYFKMLVEVLSKPIENQYRFQGYFRGVETGLSIRPSLEHIRQVILVLKKPETIDQLDIEIIKSIYAFFDSLLIDLVNDTGDLNARTMQEKRIVVVLVNFKIVKIPRSATVKTVIPKIFLKSMKAKVLKKAGVIDNIILFVWWLRILPLHIYYRYIHARLVKFWDLINPSI